MASQLAYSGEQDLKPHFKPSNVLSSRELVPVQPEADGVQLLLLVVEERRQTAKNRSPLSSPQGRELVPLLFWGLGATALRCFGAESRRLSRPRGWRRPFQATESRRPSQHKGTSCVGSEPNKLATEAWLDVSIKMVAPVADVSPFIDLEAVARPPRLFGKPTSLRRSGHRREKSITTLARSISALRQASTSALVVLKQQNAAFWALHHHPPPPHHAQLSWNLKTSPLPVAVAGADRVVRRRSRA